MFSSRTDDWETPQDIFDYCDKHEGPFTLDVCATDENTKVKEKYFTKKEDGLLQNWGGNICWMNPPYGRQIKDWIRKAHLSSR